MVRRLYSLIIAALFFAVPLAVRAQTPPAPAAEQPAAAGATVSTPAPVPEVKKPSGPKFEFHGFVGGSVFMQDAVFQGYGQQVFFVTKQPNTDRLAFGGDARQTRLNFSIAGPTVFGGATPKAVAEIDFFSGLNVGSTAGAPVGTPAGSTLPGTTGVIAVAPRLRVAYAELNWGPTVIRFGNDTDLITPFGPTSVGHIPQSFGYGAGYLSTRHVGFGLFETLPAGPVALELAAQVTNSLQSSTDADSFFGNISKAETSGIPGFEARVRLLQKGLFEVYAAGHWNSIDRNSADDVNVPAIPARFGNSQQVVIGDVGAKVTAGPLTIQGQAYSGKNVSSEAGPGILGTTPVTAGDVHEWGAWGQVGLNLTPEFSVWAFAGTEHPNYKEVTDTFGGAAGSATRLQNTNTAGMLRYQDGGYALALEGLHSHTRYAVVQAASRTAAPNGILDGNQVMLSGMYFF
jgi:hypothetical protein